jgi:hypothetical protein
MRLPDYTVTGEGEVAVFLLHGIGPLSVGREPLRVQSRLLRIPRPAFPREMIDDA